MRARIAGRATKSPEAFRTISEVADELDVPQHVLRFWESRFPQVKPLKRAGGRRYYRPEDVDLLRGIRALLYGEGFTIKGVQKVLKRARACAMSRRSAAATVRSAARCAAARSRVDVEKRPESRKKRRSHLRAVPTPVTRQLRRACWQPQTCRQ